MPNLPPLKFDDEGHTYCNDLLGAKVCTGAKHGLPQYIPADTAAPIKLRLVAVPLDRGGYAPNGAYFGWVRGLTLYHAASVEAVTVSCYDWTTNAPMVRTARLIGKFPSRESAKIDIRKTLPNASFYR